ncbi:MAG TPA: hypothetical protein VN628_19300 [Vicinamibacterales bacterium]|nr:hypothetical protein [Vicinamibacterales bacterium]
MCATGVYAQQAKTSYTPPKTAWGDPDLQGLWPSTDMVGVRRTATIRNTYVQFDDFDDPTGLGPYDRCISRGPLGSVFPVIYNNGNQIFQFPGYVVIRYEMIHEVRVVPLDGRSHVSPKIRTFMGDPRGHWEGNTLVVETTNLNGRTGAQGNGNLLMMSDEAKIVERYTRTGPETLQYEVTVNDPRTRTKPWTASFPLRRDMSYGMFEYACHEGNHAMFNILSASRAADKTARSTGGVQ